MDKFEKADRILLDSIDVLTSMHNEQLSFEALEKISNICDNLEDLRHILYGLQNDLNSNYS